MHDDASAKLARAIRGLGRHVEILDIESESWTSIAFRGERHRFNLYFRGTNAEAAADRFRAILVPRRFKLAGHILVDIAVIDEARASNLIRLACEALTVESR
jgi:hypothetical protein